jgi:hypothetical protein
VRRRCVKFVAPVRGIKCSQLMSASMTSLKLYTVRVFDLTAVNKMRSGFGRVHWLK